MPAPYSEIKYSDEVIYYFSGNPPTPDQKDCLSNAFEKIKGGKLKIYQHPYASEYYTADCSHDIVVEVGLNNEIIIIDVIPSVASSWS